MVDETTGEINSVFAAVLLVDELAQTGIDVELIETTPDQETYQFLQTFFNRKQEYMRITQILSSVSQSAAIYASHIHLNETVYDSYSISITNMSGFSSTSHVKALKGNTTTTFEVSMAGFENLPGAYFVTVKMGDGKVVRMDVLVVYDGG